MFQSLFIYPDEVIRERDCCARMPVVPYRVVFSLGSYSLALVKAYIKQLENLFDISFSIEIVRDFEAPYFRYGYKWGNKRFEEACIISANLSELVNKKKLAIHTLVRALWFHRSFVEKVAKSKNSSVFLEKIWLIAEKYDWDNGPICFPVSLPITYSEFLQNWKKAPGRNYVNLLFSRLLETPNSEGLNKITKTRLELLDKYPECGAAR